MSTPRIPKGVHVLTTIHGVGSVACLVMATGSALSAAFREGLAVSGGSSLMVDWLGPWVPLFLLGVAALLALLCYGSWRLRPWTWPLTLAAYSVGVLGSLWQVWMGIPQGFLGAVINGAVVAYVAMPRVRRAYGQSSCQNAGGRRGTDW